MECGNKVSGDVVCGVWGNCNCCAVCKAERQEERGEMGVAAGAAPCLVSSWMLSHLGRESCK